MGYRPIISSSAALRGPAGGRPFGALDSSCLHAHGQLNAVSTHRSGVPAASVPNSAVLAATPRPPYVAVIFTSTLRNDVDAACYAATAARMEELAAKQDGFLGYESARESGRLGLTVSYWRDADSARRWKHDVEHAAAQLDGRERFYSSYRVRVAIVERDYGFEGAE